MLGPTTYTPSPVLDSWDETHALHGIRVQLPPALASAHVRPGQVVKLRDEAGEGFFALASAPATAGVVDLLVKRGGKIADAAIARSARGALELTEPFGHGFPIEEAVGKDVLLFAAGSGIGPIRALVQHLAGHRDSFGRATLFYGQRHGAEFAYRGEHLAWDRAGVRVVLCPSGEDDAWPGVRGRVQEVARSLAFGGSPPEETVAFVCGMKAMVEDVRATLGQAGIPPGRVHANF
jgi:NAD(P)H-flavin reductase